MANKADGDPTAPTATPIVWLFLSDVRALVATRCGNSLGAAERLIIEYAQKRHFTMFSYHSTRNDGRSSIAPAHWGAMHPDLGLYILVDFDNNMVRYIRTEPVSDVYTPTVALAFVWELEKTLGDFGPPRPPYPEIHLVRLAEHEVLSMLRKVGLLESVPSTPTPEKSPTPPDPEKWLESIQAEFARVPSRQKSAWIRSTAFPRMQNDLGEEAPWKDWDALRRAMYPRGKKKKKI